jgi:hypothetical protein
MRLGRLSVLVAAGLWLAPSAHATTASGPPAEVVVSADGRSAYPAPRASDSIYRLFRRADGTVAFAGCLRSDATQGCADLLAVPLNDPAAEAVAPNREPLISSSVGGFVRKVVEGVVALDGCGARASAQRCRDAKDWSTGVAVSPDGASVYVASSAGDAVAHFREGNRSHIAFEGCLADDATQGCGDLADTPLTGAHGVTVSPDGASVYVVSPVRDSIAHFFRAPNGALTFDGCLAGAGAGGCANLPLAPLDGADGVAVSSDGRSVYVTAGATDSVFHFFRASNGALRYGGCLGSTSGALGLPATLSGTCGRSDLGGLPTVPRCHGKLATIIGRADRNEVKGTPGTDIIVPLDVSRVSAGNGADRVCAGRGRDLLDGGPGPDHLDGEGGSDVISGGPGRDHLDGGPGRDRCFGGGARDRARACEATRSVISESTD